MFIKKAPAFDIIKEIKANKIPTRFDDIKKEIFLERAKDYFNSIQSQKAKSNSTYILGDVIGEKLNKIM